MKKKSVEDYLDKVEKELKEGISLEVIGGLVEASLALIDEFRDTDQDRALAIAAELGALYKLGSLVYGMENMPVLPEYLRPFLTGSRKKWVM